ncbi:MAG: hypothetical protein AVDCRST_MAG02-1679 [uncultured Rubrobacteraceae bacterium]|uniref:Uncharacterized protein n=1 Tax=uncultured Rubrobacteraceae bacterium TaxID=349277 RepID=A0A6J4QZG3_9ACTN|nr:MAG: hypothetical protein AVDCRST_MAG02-1679 [uncultured Rubrobacteraceae bacterium]
MVHEGRLAEGEARRPGEHAERGGMLRPGGRHPGGRGRRQAARAGSAQTGAPTIAGRLG